MKNLIISGLFSLIIVLFASCAKEDVGDILDEHADAGKTNISGVLADKDGKPIEGAIVGVVGDNGTPDFTDASGAFIIGNVTPGRVKIKIYHKDWVDTSGMEIDIADGQKYVMDTPLVLAWNYYKISGVVGVGDNNQGLENAGVSIARTTITTSTKPGGNFTIDRIPRDIQGDIIIFAAKNGFGNKTTTILHSDLVDYDVTPIGSDIILVKSGVNVTGTVINTNGLPKEGVIVQAVGAGLQDTTDVWGRYRLENVPTGQTGVRITVSLMKSENLIGSVMGINGVEGATIFGLDIYLKPAPIEQNGMIIQTSDQIAIEDDGSVILEVYPEIQTS